MSQTLPNEWVSTPLCEVGKWGGGGTPSKANTSFWEDGTIPWITSKDMKWDVLRDSELHINSDAIRGSSARLIPKDSVAVVARSGILEHTLPVALVPFEATYNQDLKVVTPNPDVLPKFLLFAIQGSGQEILGTCRKSGTTVASIEWTRFLQFKIAMAPLAEQQRIVEILEEQFSRLDAALAGIRTVREKTAAFRLSLLEATFSPSHDGSAWQTMKLGDVAKWSSGGTPKSKTPEYYGGNIPWAVSGDLNNSLVFETTATITEAGLAKSSAKVVPEGTVLIAMYGATIGKTGIASRPMATNQAIATAIVNEKIVTNRFLHYFLMSQKRLFTLAGQGMAQPNISQTILKAWKIAVPSTEVQEDVVNRLSEQLEFVQRTLGMLRLLTLKLEAERRSLLHAAFEGTLTKQWRETHHA